MKNADKETISKVYMLFRQARGVRKQPSRHILSEPEPRQHILSKGVNQERDQ